MSNDRFRFIGAVYEDPPLVSETNPAVGHSIRQSIRPMLALGRMRIGSPSACGTPDEPPQKMKDYEPEWERSFWTGTATASCDHARFAQIIVEWSSTLASQPFNSQEQE